MKVTKQGVRDLGSDKTNRAKANSIRKNLCAMSGHDFVRTKVETHGLVRTEYFTCSECGETDERDVEHEFTRY